MYIKFEDIIRWNYLILPILILPFEIWWHNNVYVEKVVKNMKKLIV